MDKWQEFQNELNNFITEMGKSSPVQIEVKSLGENQLMLHNKRNQKYVRLDYVSTKELLFIESSAGKRYSVPLRQPWDEVATFLATTPICIALAPILKAHPGV